MTTTLSLRIAPDHPALAGHFPGNPIVPGVVLLDLAIRALARRGGLDEAGIQLGSADFDRDDADVTVGRTTQRYRITYHTRRASLAA